MCDERERLIGYVYDECDAAERAEVQAHLSGCATCREEINGLRTIRQDLLAWDVPAHESVWRPFAPARVAPSWKDLSSWALAAAAGIIFMVGVAGGVTARGWLPGSGATAIQAADSAPTSAPVSVTTEDLRQLEQRLRAELREEMRVEVDQRVGLLVSQRPAVTGRPFMASQTAELQDLRARVTRIEELSYEQAQLNASFDSKLGRFLNLSSRGLNQTEIVPVSFGGPSGAR